MDINWPKTVSSIHFTQIIAPTSPCSGRNKQGEDAYVAQLIRVMTFFFSVKSDGITWGAVFFFSLNLVPSAIAIDITPKIYKSPLHPPIFLQTKLTFLLSLSLSLNSLKLETMKCSRVRLVLVMVSLQAMIAMLPDGAGAQSEQLNAWIVLQAS